MEDAPGEEVNGKEEVPAPPNDADDDVDDTTEGGAKLDGTV